MEEGGGGDEIRRGERGAAREEIRERESARRVGQERYLVSVCITNQE